MLILVTPNFLNSDFIYEHELGPLLKEAKLGGVKILWVPVRASSYEETALKDYQALLHPSTPLAKMTEPDRDTAWVKICDEIEKQLTAAAQKEVAYARLLEEAAEAEAGLAADHFKMAWNTAFRECRHGQTGFRGGQQADETVATTHNTVVDLRSL